MSNDYLEALEYFETFLREMKDIEQCPSNYFESIYWKYKNTLETTIKQALLELKAIKEAEPSEALKCVNELWQDINVENNFRNDFKHLKTIEQALLKLQSIKESNPNEALKILEEVKYAPSFMGGNDRYRTYLGSDKLYENDINIIKQYILKSQEQEKVLDTVIKKEVNIMHFSEEIKELGEKFTYEFYLLEFDNYHYFVKEENKLTQEEFELLKRYFNER